MTRSTATPKRPDDEYETTTSARRSSASGNTSYTGGYRTQKDWASLDPTARADYHRHAPRGADDMRNADNFLDADYVDVWNSTYEPHSQYREEWQRAIQSRGMRVGSDSVGGRSSSASSAAREFDPLQEALRSARSESNNGRSTSTASHEEEQTPSVDHSSSATSHASQNDSSAEESETSSYCPTSQDDESDATTGGDESEGDARRLREKQAKSQRSTASRYDIRETSKRSSTSASDMPAGSKNARRKRQRMTTRQQEKHARLQEELGDTEREAVARSKSTSDAATRRTTRADVETPTRIRRAVVPGQQPPRVQPNGEGRSLSSTSLSTSSAESSVVTMPAKYTTDDFFNAVEAAISHAQSTSKNDDVQQSANAKKSARSKEPPLVVLPNAYMRQICGTITGTIDPLVAYRMIFTVDYIRHIHHFWQSRMHIPVALRPRMRLSTAANYLRNDSLFIDNCRLLETHGAHDGLPRTLVQFDCKFNNMCMEDQEEADQKREPFRPFNEVELRADVDEYGTATSVWVCENANSDNCTSAMLTENPKAFDRPPMGDVVVYWDSFVLGFRNTVTVQV